MLTAEYLQYPADDLTPEYLLATLDIESTTEAVAYNALKLLAAAYEAHFEDPAMYLLPLAPGTVRAHFDPENDVKVRRHRQRMQDSLDNGSSYLYIHQVGGRPDITDNGAMAGLVKTSPSQSGLGRLMRKPPNVFINDVLVHPALQQTAQRLGRAAGATLMHSALGHTGFSPDRSAALHAFEADTTAEWYDRLGFRQAGQVAPVEIGEEALPQLLYVSRNGVTIGSIQRTLEQRHPQLALGSLIPKDTPVEPHES